MMPFLSDIIWSEALTYFVNKSRDMSHDHFAKNRK